MTGRDRLVPNVLFSWAAYSVFIVAGFVTPRVIDRQLGQELLGVWDFAWSLVGYFSLVQMGMISSVSRYVARHRMAGDLSSLNGVVSSALLIMSLSGLVALGLAGAVALLLPLIGGSRLGGNVQEAQWVVFLLGATVAVQVALGAFHGVLTGCHRWELHNLNTSGWHAATVAGMIIAMLLGGRLWVLAVITFAGETLSGVRRVILARRACPGLHLQLSSVRWSTIKELFVFGAKTLIPSISNLLLNQTTSVLVLAYLGPAALALYSRPRSLILHVETVVRKMSMTLTPTISSLEKAGDAGQIRDLLIKATRYSCYLALPITLVLTIFGDAIMQLWMGSNYAMSLVPAILAAGHFTVLAQLPAWNVLVGLDGHGRVGTSRFVASVCSVGLSLVVLSCFNMGLVGTALAVTLPLALVNTVDIPLLVCRRTGLSVRKYIWAVALGPVIHVTPFAICLVIARLIFPVKPLWGLAWGGTVGAVVLGVLYWRYVLPERIRARASAALRLRVRI